MSWSGQKVREWAEELAQRVESGNVEMELDFDKLPYEEVWTIRLTRGPGETRDSREERLAQLDEDLTSLFKEQDATR